MSPEEKERVMQVYDTLVKFVGQFFDQQKIPTRKMLVNSIRGDRPDLISPRLELEVAKALNFLVDHGLLQRFGTGDTRGYGPRTKRTSPRIS